MYKRQVLQRAGSVATRFGWKASADHWNDSAVWVQAQETYSGTWQQLLYPKGHALSTRPVDLAFAIETQQAGAGPTYRRLVADDWQCNSATSVTGIVWWGSYIGYGYQPCECSQMTPPRQPDYFQLAIWSDAPDPTPSDPVTFSYPAEKIWEYTAKDFDEVMVGFDKHPEAGEAGRHRGPLHDERPIAHLDPRHGVPVADDEAVAARHVELPLQLEDIGHPRSSGRPVAEPEAPGEGPAGVGGLPEHLDRGRVRHGGPGRSPPRGGAAERHGVGRDGGGRVRVVAVSPPLAAGTGRCRRPGR